MDLDEMLEEITRLQGELKKLDPKTEAYSTAVKNYHELMKTFHEELESRDSDLDHSLKRELDKARLELSKVEEKNRVTQGRWDVVVNVLKIAGSVAATFGAIILTGSLEETTILSQKCFSLVRNVLPKL